MPLVMEDLGELVYGGLVTGMKRWDKNRVTSRKITDKDLLKKASFYAYLAPGVISTGAVAFGMLRRYEAWTERLAHGFIYGFPEFVWDLVDTFRTPAAGTNAIMNEADRILASSGARHRASAYQFDNIRLT